MKKLAKLFGYLLIFSQLFIISCSKDEEKKDAKVPIVETTEIKYILSRSVQCNCEVISDNGFAIIEKGACWSTTPDPTIANQRTNEGSGAEDFNTFVENLEPGTKYFMRAYAKNSEGVGYGNNLTFTTDLELGQKFQGGIIFWLEEGENSSFGGVIIAENNLDVDLGYEDALSACDNLELNGYSDWFLIEEPFCLDQLEFCVYSCGLDKINMSENEPYWITYYGTPGYFYYDKDEKRFYVTEELPEYWNEPMHVRPCRPFSWSADM